MRTPLPSCSVCGGEAAFQDPKRDDHGWYCIDHTPVIWSPTITLEAGAAQIGRRAKMAALYIRARGQLPSIREELDFNKLAELENAKHVTLPPKLEKKARYFERVALSIECGSEVSDGSPEA